MAAAVDGAIGGRIQVPGTHGKHQMFECLSFEWIVHDSAGGFQGCYLDNHRNDWRCARAVRALCENAPSAMVIVDRVPLPQCELCCFARTPEALRSVRCFRFAQVLWTAILCAAFDLHKFCGSAEVRD